MNATNTQLRDIATRQPGEKPKDFQGMLKVYASEIARALPAHLNVDRMSRLALTEFRRQPLLGKCEPATIFGSVIQAAQLGLEIGLNGQAYLVPFWNNKKNRYDCQFIPGYRGLIALARRSGEILSVNAQIVHANDRYQLIYGTEERLVHEPLLSGDRGNPIFGYCIAKFKDGGHHIEAMTWELIQGIKARSKSKNKEGEAVGPWVSDEMEMARKTVIRRASKYWPMSVELAKAIDLDSAAARGIAQDLTPETALDTDYRVVAEDNDEESVARQSQPQGQSKPDEPPEQRVNTSGPSLE